MKRIVAIIVGYLLWSVLWISYNLALHKAGQLPAELSQPFMLTVPLLELIAGSVVFSLLTGFIVAKITGAYDATAVLVTALLLFATGVFFQSRVWHLMPLWYHLALLLFIFPMCLAGARMASSPAGSTP